MKYYINVKELMDKSAGLPRPRKKHPVSIIVNHGEWLPIIDGDTGKVVIA